MFSKDTTNEVFGQINKMMKYGAPELKLFYQKYVTKGLLISVSTFIFLSVLSFGYISSSKEKVDEKIEPKYRIFTPEDLETSPLINKVLPFTQKISLKDLSALIPEPFAKNW